MSVGDVNSSARGSGARFNDDKIPYDLIPITMLYETWLPLLEDEEDCALEIGHALATLKSFQKFGDKGVLQCFIANQHKWLEETALVFAHGRKKYAAWNWAKGMDWSVPVGCALRHIQAIIAGQKIDPESNQHHFAHVMCNMIMLLHFTEHYKEGDDITYKAIMPEWTNSN